MKQILLTPEENPSKITREYVNKSYPNGIPKGYHILQDVGYHYGFEDGAKAQLKKVVGFIEGFTCNAATQRWKDDLLEPLLKEAGL